MSIHINLWINKNGTKSYTVEDINGNYINHTNCTNEERELIIDSCNHIIELFKNK